jgi:hypothetical protein
MKKPKLGSGGRFNELKSKLEGQGKSADSAKAIATSIGRQAYGNAKMNQMAQAGRKKSSGRGR